MTSRPTPSHEEVMEAAIDEPVAGEETRRMLLAELEQLAAAERLWGRLVAQGVVEGSKARLEALFMTRDEGAAMSLASELAGDDWGAEVTALGDGRLRVRVVTRPLVMGPEVLVELANQMVDAGRLFSCEFTGLRLASRPRPWWKFW
jgi:hypothetical protein